MSRPDHWTCDRRAGEIVQKFLTEDVGYGTVKEDFEKAGINVKSPILFPRLVVLIRDALESGYKETKNLGVYNGDSHSGVFATDEEMKKFQEIGCQAGERSWLLVNRYCQSIAVAHGLDGSLWWAPNTEGEFIAAGAARYLEENVRLFLRKLEKAQKD